MATDPNKWTTSALIVHVCALRYVSFLEMLVLYHLQQRRNKHVNYGTLYHLQQSRNKHVNYGTLYHLQQRRNKHVNYGTLGVCVMIGVL